MKNFLIFLFLISCVLLNAQEINPKYVYKRASDNNVKLSSILIAGGSAALISAPFIPHLGFALSAVAYQAANASLSIALAAGGVSLAIADAGVGMMAVPAGVLNAFLNEEGEIFRLLKGVEYLLMHKKKAPYYSELKRFTHKINKRFEIDVDEPEIGELSVSLIIDEYQRLFCEHEKKKIYKCLNYSGIKTLVLNVLLTGNEGDAFSDKNIIRIKGPKFSKIAY